jgi:hypothetical protein
MRNIWDKNRRGNQNTHFIFNNFFFYNCVAYEKMRKNILEQDRPQMTKRRMRIACWMPNATNTRSEYVIRIAFPLQQWLHERARCRYTYIVRLVENIKISTLIARTTIFHLQLPKHVNM